MIFLFFSIVLRDDGFLTARNLLNIVLQTAPITMMAVGMVFVLTAGEIDLSIGSIVAVSALSAAVVASRLNPGSSAPSPASPPARRSARVNGVLVAYLRLPSFLVTLATMGLFAGVARWLTDLRSVPITNDDLHRLLRRGSAVRRPSL